MSISKFPRTNCGRSAPLRRRSSGTRPDASSSRAKRWSPRRWLRVSRSCPSTAGTRSVKRRWRGCRCSPPLLRSSPSSGSPFLSPSILPRAFSWPSTASATQATWALFSVWRTGSASTVSSLRPIRWNCTIGGHVYGTFLNGENLYSKALDCGREAPSLIVIGNESNGISPAVAACVRDRLFIPPYPADDPGSESLNAAIATAITVAEFRRRLL